MQTTKLIFILLISFNFIHCGGIQESEPTIFQPPNVEFSKADSFDNIEFIELLWNESVYGSFSDSDEYHYFKFYAEAGSIFSIITAPGSYTELNNIMWLYPPNALAGGTDYLIYAHTGPDPEPYNGRTAVVQFGAIESGEYTLVMLNAGPYRVPRYYLQLICHFPESCDTPTAGN